MKLTGHVDQRPWAKSWAALIFSPCQPQCTLWGEFGQAWRPEFVRPEFDQNLGEWGWSLPPHFDPWPFSCEVFVDIGRVQLAGRMNRCPHKSVLGAAFKQIAGDSMLTDSPGFALSSFQDACKANLNLTGRITLRVSRGNQTA